MTSMHVCTSKIIIKSMDLFLALSGINGIQGQNFISVHSSPGRVSKIIFLFTIFIFIFLLLRFTTNSKCVCIIEVDTNELMNNILVH